MILNLVWDKNFKLVTSRSETVRYCISFFHVLQCFCVFVISSDKKNYYWLLMYTSKCQKCSFKCNIFLINYFDNEKADNFRKAFFSKFLNFYLLLRFFILVFKFLHFQICFHFWIDFNFPLNFLLIDFLTFSFWTLPIKPRLFSAQQNHAMTLFPYQMTRFGSVV